MRNSDNMRRDALPRQSVGGVGTCVTRHPEYVRSYVRQRQTQNLAAQPLRFGNNRRKFVTGSWGSDTLHVEQTTLATPLPPTESCHTLLPMLLPALARSGRAAQPVGVFKLELLVTWKCARCRVVEGALVIFYVLAVAVVNLAFGFALAVYQGRRSARPRRWPWNRCRRWPRSLPRRPTSSRRSRAAARSAPPRRRAIDPRSARRGE